jgi:hypothetical protein
MRVSMCVCASCVLLSMAAAEQPSVDARSRARVTGGTDQDEFLLDTSFTALAAPYSQDRPAAAFNGSVFLMVWTDKRRDCDSADILGTRLLPDGTVLDQSSIAISLAQHSQSAPAVCFDGTDFLVVWEDRRNDGEYQDIYGARVSPDGTVLDTGGIVISAADGHQRYPAAVFDGTNSLVVWDDGRTGDLDIRGARVTPDGTVLDTEGLVILQAVDSQQHPDVSADGTNSLVAWYDGRIGLSGICGARVTPQGTVLDTQGFTISPMWVNDSVFPAIEFGGDNFLVVWENGSGGIWGARVTPQGTVLDPDGLILSLGFHYFPDLAFDGEKYLAVWYEDICPGDIFGVRVAADGMVLDTAEIRITRELRLQTNPCAAFGGTNFVVAWQDCRVDGIRSDIYGARVTSEGAVIEPDGFLVSMAASGQTNPAAAFDGDNFLAVWQDGRDSSVKLYGARVAANGTLLDSSGFPIARGGDQWYPDAAPLDSNFLVVWQDLGDVGIRGARVTSGGIVLDPGGLVISGASGTMRTPAIACDSAQYFVVWHDARNDDGDIYGARVSADGTVLDPDGIPISRVEGSQESPSIAWDGADFLVVWAELGGSPEIRGARVAPDGTVLDSTGLLIWRGRSRQGRPSAAWGDSSFLVVWEDRRGLTGYDITGARVSPAGVVLDTAGIEIAVAEGQQYAPDVVYNGAGFMVVWQDLQPGGLADIHGAVVSSAGIVLSSGPIVTQDGAQDCPKVCQGSGEAMFLVYQGWAGTVGVTRYNNRRVWGMMDPSVGIVGRRPDEKAAAEVPRATICRVSLVVPNRQEAALLDITGRQVTRLRSGYNDIRHVAPGVYFIQQLTADSRQPTAVRKVVVQR